MGPVWCVVVGGGSGRRYGGAKQFERLAGRRVIDHSVAAAAAVCDGVVAVVPADSLDTDDGVVPGTAAVVAGGADRVGSVRAGLAVVPADAEVVLVHDAARPLASTDLFARVVAAVRSGAEAVIPVVPVADTIRELTGAPAGSRVVDRDRLRAVQTPQGFDAAVLRAAYAGDAEATDDAGVVEAAGATVTLVDGEAANRKITDPDDRVTAAAVLAARMEDRPA
ncbi:MAG: IspD/TarI family cytidylyltransferase [Microthrixaceae bacterium]